MFTGTIGDNAGVSVVTGAPPANGSGSGSVVGPSSSTDNAIARFDGTTGQLLQNSVVLISDLGVITGGTWQGTVVAATYGGTGVANSGTITVSGNVTIGSTTNTVSFATTGNTSITLPTTGTLATLAGSETLTNKTISGASNTLTVLAGSQLSGQVPLANGGTGANLTDPNSDKILFWDDSAGAVTWLEPGTGISITNTTISVTGFIIGSISDGRVAYGTGTDTIGGSADFTWNDSTKNLVLVRNDTSTGTSLLSLLQNSTGDVSLSLAIGSTRQYLFGIDNSDSDNLKISTAATGASLGTGDLFVLTTAGAATFTSSATATAFIPSSSTVPTNGLYLPASNTLGFAINSAGEMQLTASALSPTTNDGLALGTTTLMWADLFLASGGVINFNNGDVTVTHSADTLTLAGGTLVLPNTGLQVGSSVPFSDSSGTLTLQNVDALDATTEATIEASIDTLANLTSIQGHTVTLTGAFIRSGAHSLTLTTTNTTSVTLPTSGTLISSTSTATRTMVLTAAGGWPSTTSGSAINTKVEFTTNDQDLYLLDFDQSTDEFAQWTVVMPDSYDGGTITAVFIWTANSTSTNSVVWGIQGRAYADGDAIDATWGTAQTVTDANGSSANTVRISSATPACTLAGTPAGGQLVQLRAYRDADNGSDNLAADARLIAVKIEYGINAYSD